MVVEGVYSKSVQGGKWIIISNVVQKFLSLVTFFVLARLLIPEDYGIIAVVFLITGFFVNIFAIDFQKALMQRADSDTLEEGKWLDTIWTFNLFKSLFFAIIILFLAKPIANFFHITSSINILLWGSLFVFIPALANSRQYYFFKNIEFKKIFWRDTVGQIFYIAVTFLWLFCVSQSVWALLAGHLARYISTVAMSYILFPYYQKMSFQFSQLKKLFGYAKWTTGQNILDYILGIIDSLYIGHLLDANRLGLYTKARDISFIPVSPFFIILDKVGFVAYAQLQGKLEKIQEGFLKTFDVVISVTIPLFLLLLVEGGMIVELLLGKNWLGIVVPLKILSASIIFSSLVAITRPIFDAIGRPDINVKSNIIQLISSISLVYVGAQYYGVNGIAFAMLISWMIILGYVILNARPFLHLGRDKFFGSLITVTAAVVAVLVVSSPLYIYSKFIASNITYSIILVCVSGIAYITALWLVGRLFRHSPWQTLISIWHEIRSR